MTITLIAAVARNGIIGRDGGMPWHVPGELKSFKAATLGHPLIMGRRTFESVGALPGRRTVVLTRDADWSADGVEVAHTLDEALFLTQDEDVFVAGGAEIYALALPIADRMLLSEIPSEPVGDTVFPGWPFTNSPDWQEVSRVPHDGWTVVTWERTLARTRIEVGPQAPGATEIKASAACAVLDGARLLLTRREDNGLWCLPGGGVDPGETWAQAAVREVREETGLNVTAEGVLAAYSDSDIVVVYRDGRRVNIFGVCFRASVADGTANTSDEVTEVAWLTQSQTARLPIVPLHRPLVRAAFAAPETPPLFS